ncbi:MAG TPA: DUF418 domain-containing protein [Pyrinomonadaceae bacterium]|nr:DUF418 domain-containing protein [Pyrinomonadaceae bacterium]
MQPSGTPKRAADRVEFVDALRGFALLGVFAANLFIFSGHVYMTDEQQAALPTAGVDHVVHLLELVFVENKFMGLFSLLFGVSFWLFLDRAMARGADATRLFYRRIGWLFIIGAAHAWLFWLWDILRFYALWGLLLPLFLRVSNRVLLRVALFFAVLVPALIGGFRSLLMEPAPGRTALNALALETFSSGTYAEVLRVNWLYDWDITLSVGQIAYQVALFGRLLLGLYAARLSLHVDLERHSKLFRTLLIGGAIIGVACNILIAGRYLDSPAAGGFFLPFGRRFIAQTGYLALTLAYASALALLFRASWWRRYLLMFAPVGRMALTCYLLQTLFGLWLFYGFMPGPGLMGKIGPVWLVLVWLGGYAVQVWFASLWLRRFRYGPAEWLWRSLTYWKLQPLRLAARPAV